MRRLYNSFELSAFSGSAFSLRRRQDGGARLHAPAWQVPRCAPPHAEARDDSTARRTAEINVQPPAARARSLTRVASPVDGPAKHFCLAANFSRRTHYRWLKTDHAYKGAFERAKVETARGLEDEGRRRAFEGVLEGTSTPFVPCFSGWTPLPPCAGRPPRARSWLPRSIPGTACRSRSLGRCCSSHRRQGGR